MSILLLECSPETNQLELKNVNLEIPKWGWEFLKARAESLHEGDLSKTINEVFFMGVQGFMQLAEVQPSSNLIH